MTIYRLPRAIRQVLWMAAAASTSLSAPGAFAASDSDSDKSNARLDELVITGSSIKRVETEGSLPVQVFSQEDISRSGMTSVTDFIQQIPAMQGFTAASDSVGGTGGGVTTASLHDVGEQYTLVLLNGRRVAPSDSGTTIDLNSIPLAAIQRIDVLTDGASAVYGADAIAGVVNFVLKQGDSPFTVDARYSKPKQGGGQQVNFSMGKGIGNFAADGYSAYLAASYDKIDPLAAKQRAFSKTGILEGVDPNTGLNYYLFNGSSRSIPPNVDVFFTDNSYIHINPYLQKNGSCPASHVKLDADGLGLQCYFDYASTIQIAPQIERTAVYGSGKLALGSTGWNLFSDIAFTDVGTLTRIAPYPAEFGIDVGSAAYNTYVLPYLTAPQAAMVDSINVKYRLYELGNRTTEYNTKSLHIVAGVNGKIGGWDVTAAATSSGQEQDEKYLEGWPLADDYTTAINSGAIDPFPYSLGTMPAAQVSALRATQFKGLYTRFKIDMTAFDVNAQKGLFALAGGDFVLSMGADYHDNAYKKEPQPVAADALILFDDPQPSSSFQRSSTGLYGEVLAPIAKQAELSAAVRYDQVSGVKDKLNSVEYGSKESASTFKIGAKWQPITSILLRASYGTGFRVATMNEIAQPKVDFGVTGNTYNCPFSASFDPLGYISKGYLCPNKLQYEEFQGGNPKLKPEKSNQWNIGFVWEPIADFSLGLNYWSVSIKDGVSTVDESLIIKDPAKYLSLYTTKFKTSNNLTYVAILQAPINIGKTENTGVDWDIAYSHNFTFGKLQSKLAGTHLTKSRYTLPGTDDQWATSLGKYGVDDNVAFNNIINFSTTLEHGSWAHTVNVRYRDDYKDVEYSEDDCTFFDKNDNCKAGALHVPAFYTVDWHTTWEVVKNVTVAAGIDNLLDKDAPRSLRTAGSHQLGFDPRYASPYGRTYVANVTLKYLETE